MKPSRSSLIFATLTCLALLAGCSSSGKHASGTKTSVAKKGGGYYLDDGPGSDIPANLHAIPDAVPRIEPHATATSRPYRVFGIQYVPKTGNQAFRQKGIASWYGKKFHGNKTANGETYDMYAMTAAHPTLPIPSYARVTRTATKQSVIVRINDRGPFHSSRIIDLSYVAASKLGLIGPGKGEVIVEAITHDDIAKGNYAQPAALAQAKPVSQPASLAATANPAPKLVAATQQATEVPDALQVLAASAPQAGASNRVFLQFGAFSGAENAQQLAHRLNQQLTGIENRPVHIDNRQDLYRVRLGPYPSRTEAVNVAARIHELAGVIATVAAR